MLNSLKLPTLWNNLNPFFVFFFRKWPAIVNTTQQAKSAKNANLFILTVPGGVQPLQQPMNVWPASVITMQGGADSIWNCINCQGVFQVNNHVLNWEQAWLSCIFFLLATVFQRTVLEETLLCNDGRLKCLLIVAWAIYYLHQQEITALDFACFCWQSVAIRTSLPIIA